MEWITGFTTVIGAVFIVAGIVGILILAKQELHLKKLVNKRSINYDTSF